MMKKQIEQVLDSREVAEMMEKKHYNLIRDIKGYTEELNELEIEAVDFFRESTYRDSKGETRPRYDVTRKGCEFIAHKLTGIKGTGFTARYVNRFHDMEDALQEEGRGGKIPRPESLASVNNAVKILTPLLQQAGCTAEIQLLTARTLYEKAGISIPLEIKADKHYVDTVHIARHVGLYYQSSGKPADKAVNEIIRRLDLPESMYTETWESKGNWQGAVRKYDEAVILMVAKWYCENGYPRNIEYTQVDGQKKCYHVMWRDREVA